jgi:hypothetical protein
VPTSERLEKLAASLALLLGGCGAADPSAAEPDAAPATPIACELGQLTDGAFTPLGPDTRAELVLGFQGFLFFELAVRTAAPAPSAMDAAISLALDDRDPVGASQLDVPLTATADGHAVTDTVQVFLSSGDVGAYVGHTARIALRLDGGGRTCAAEGTVRLVDDDPCIHTGDRPICPGDPPP